MSEIERLDNMTEKELDAELRKFGVEPEKLEQYAFQKVCVLAREQAAEIQRLQDQARVMREALESIAANTCCDSCREAALVARAALAQTEPRP